MNKFAKIKLSSQTTEKQKKKLKESSNKLFAMNGWSQLYSQKMIICSLKPT